MGLITAMLTLSNPRRTDLEPVQADALADTGSVYLIIPEHVRLQLALEATVMKEVTLANGSKRMGPVCRSDRDAF